MLDTAQDRRIHALLIAGILLNLVGAALCVDETSRSQQPRLSTPSGVDSTACLSAEQVGKKVVVEQLVRAISSLHSGPLDSDLTDEGLHYAHDVALPLSRLDHTLQSCAIRLQV